MLWSRNRCGLCIYSGVELAVPKKACCQFHQAARHSGSVKVLGRIMGSCPEVHSETTPDLIFLFMHYLIALMGAFSSINRLLDKPGQFYYHWVGSRWKAKTISLSLALTSKAFPWKIYVLDKPAIALTRFANRRAQLQPTDLLPRMHMAPKSMVMRTSKCPCWTHIVGNK